MIIHIYTDLDNGVVVPLTIAHPLQSGDSYAHEIKVHLSKGGKEFEPQEGTSVIAYFQTPSSNTPYSKTGFISGNICTVEIPNNAYRMSGEVIGIVRLVKDSVTTTVAKIFAYATADVNQSGANTPTNAWTVSQVEGYMNRLVQYINEFDSVKADINSKIDDFIDNFNGDTESIVHDWLDEHFENASWRLTDEDKQAIANEVSTQYGGEVATVRSDLDTHRNNTNIHVTSADKTAWNGKQDSIDNIQSIQNNYMKGAYALGAADYSSSQTYDVGAFVVCDNALWRCLVRTSSRPSSSNSNWGNESLSTIGKVSYATAIANVQAFNTTNLKLLKFGNAVTLSGNVQRSGQITSGAAIIQIPEGYRPITISGTKTYVTFYGWTTRKIYCGEIETGSSYIKLYIGNDSLDDTYYAVNASWVTI